MPNGHWMLLALPPGRGGLGTVGGLETGGCTTGYLLASLRLVETQLTLALIVTSGYFAACASSPPDSKTSTRSAERMRCALMWNL